MAHPFLTARWQNLAVVTYAVPPAVLEPYLPPSPAGTKLELDTKVLASRPGESQAFVSLVAFEFVQTRVLGIRWPGLSSFAEINLRFYVRAGPRRGVAFIREIVPKSLIVWGARKTYNEPYVGAPVFSEVKQQNRSIGVEYRLHWPEGGLNIGQSALGRSARDLAFREHFVRLLAAKPVSRPGPDSLEQWLLHHQWGFGRGHDSQGIVYEVIHPLWGVYPVLETHVNIDFASVFGPDFGFLNAAKPFSSILAVGSEVAVFPKQRSVGVRWGERSS